MTPAELREFIAVAREEKLKRLEIGDVRFELADAPAIAAAPPPAPEPTKPEPPPAPIGPDGRPMSSDDQMLFASSLGTWPEEEAAQ